MDLNTHNACLTTSNGVLCELQLTMDGIKGTFRGVLTDIDRMTQDGIVDLGTLSFQQFKPTGTTVSHCQPHLQSKTCSNVSP